MTFRILHVCTGNISRSPMAELVMSHLLTTWPQAVADQFAVSSAGTWGHSGSPIEPEAAKALADRGVDASAFRASELTPAVVEPADLVLTATREHRGAVVALVPAAVRRTFTLREFARLVGHADPALRAVPGAGPADLGAGARQFVAGVVALRGFVPAPDPAEADDVVDPYGAPLFVYEQRLQEITEAVERVVAALVPGS